MNAHVCRAVAAAVVTAAVGLTACGEAGEPGASREGAFTIGLLLPGAGGREHQDRSLTEAKIKELCGNCPMQYANARDDAATQRQQIDSMITKGVDVLILEAVDPKAMRSSVEAAHQAGIPVVAYDRLAEGPISGYVTFDGARVGRIQAEALLRAMSAKAHGGQIVMMNGATTDSNAGWFKRGALSVLKGKVKIGKSYDIVEWRAQNAYNNMVGAIAALGADNIDGVYAANDNLASGVIAALKAAKIKPLPPVTGQDADLGAVQRIVSGDQYMTVYKPFRSEASTAAEMAVALGRGEKLGAIAKDRVSSPTTKDIPAVLLAPVSVTADNIKGTVVKDGMHTIDQICTPESRSACKKAGLTP